MKKTASAPPTEPQRQGCKTKNYNTGRQRSQARGTSFLGAAVGHVRTAHPSCGTSSRGTRCTSFAVSGGNAPPESVPSEVSPTFHSARVQPCWSLGSCLAPSSTTFRLPRQRVSSSSTIRQIQKWRRAPPATLRRISEPPGRRPHRRGMCRHPAVRVVNGGRPASPKRRPGINRRAICFSFSLCCPRIPYPALPSCASNALAVTTTRSVCPFHHSSCGAVLPLYCRRNRHGVRIASSNRSCPVDSEQLCRTT